MNMLIEFLEAQEQLMKQLGKYLFRHYLNRPVSKFFLI